jgi:tetratricopeptide (TPR) repeat protein
MVNEMAEHALWSIWFRGGNDEANAELQKGARCMDDRKLECAVKHFNHAITISPQFAEAYNQRAIAFYLLEQFDRSIEDCRQAVKLMPCHFGAWAGMGHCHAHEGRLNEALLCYKKALSINPHLECLRETVEEIERQLAEE